MVKWLVLDWDTGNCYEFKANNPIRFIKKFIKTYPNNLINYTVEAIK